MRRQAWVVGTLIGVVVLAALGGVIIIPLLLHPPLSKADLGGVSDAKERITLQQAQAKLQNDTRSTLLQGFGGLVLFIGAIATWRELQISRHGQITERLTRAVDQLASKSIDVRLGGLYALERVAKDSYQDRATVTSILTAFVRTHAPWPTGIPKDHQHPTRAINDDLPWMQNRAEDARRRCTLLHIDHTAATRVLLIYPSRTFVRPVWAAVGGVTSPARTPILQARDYKKPASTEPSWQRSARGPTGQARLIDAKLIGAHLQYANLQEADLRGTDLRQACLEGANLTGIKVDQRTKWPEDFDPTSLPGA